MIMAGELVSIYAWLDGRDIRWPLGELFGAIATVADNELYLDWDGVTLARRVITFRGVELVPNSALKPEFQQ